MEIDFSVIIPTLEEEKTINNTVLSIKKSAQQQSYNIEIIIVDGGSRDSTVSLAKKLGCRVFTLKERGISKARNFGAKKSKGKILVFIDADVVVPDNFFEEIGNVFENEDVIGANCNVMPNNKVRPSLRETLFYRLWGVVKYLFYYIRPCGTGENGIIIRREVFDEIGGFREDLETIEDLDFVFRASTKGKFVFLRNITIYETIRRFRSMGTLNFTFTYITNFLYYMITKKTRIKEWSVVR